MDTDEKRCITDPEDDKPFIKRRMTKNIHAPIKKSNSNNNNNNNKFQHTIKIFVENSLLKELSWTGRIRYKKFCNNEIIQLPKRDIGIKVEYTNNFENDKKVILDLWDDFKITKDYAHYPYPKEEFLRFSYIIKVNDVPMKLFLAASDTLDSKFDLPFRIDSVIFEKCTVCTICKTVDPKMFTMEGNKIINCSECSVSKR